MGCFPGKPVDTSTSEYITIENRYHQTIKVKFEFDRPIAQEYEAGGGGKVGAMGFNLGAKGYKMERKEWDLIKTEFTSIKHAHFFPRKANIKDKVYLTVVTDDQEVNIHTWLIEANTNLIISEQGELQITTAKTKTKDTETDIRKAESKRTSNERMNTSEDKYRNKTSSGDVPPKPSIGSQNNSAELEEYGKASNENENKNDKTKEAHSAEERTTGKPRQNISLLSARKSRSIEVKVKDDTRDCNIQGMAVTNNGTILLADWNNENIKSVSPDNKVMSVLPLSWHPNAITVLDTTTAVVAAINNKFYIINITDDTTLSLRSESQLDYEILAMVAYNGNLAVTCDTSPATTRLITIDGRVLWSVCRDTTGENLFDMSKGITTTSITDTTAVVVVSDFRKNTLTLLEAQTGTFIRSIDVGEREEPCGITTDSDGNVYVCYSKTHRIHVWSADFQESNILLSTGDQLRECPRCIVYSAVDTSLYVSYSRLSGSSRLSDSRYTVDSFRLV